MVISKNVIFTAISKNVFNGYVRLFQKMFSKIQKLFIIFKYVFVKNMMN